MTKWLAGRTFPQPPCGDSRGGHVDLDARMVYTELRNWQNLLPIESEQLRFGSCWKSSILAITACLATLRLPRSSQVLYRKRKIKQTARPKRIAKVIRCQNYLTIFSARFGNWWLDEHPDETGKHIESRLGHHYGRQILRGYDKKVVMNKVGAWRAAANSKQKTKAKKLLID